MMISGEALAEWCARAAAGARGFMEAARPTRWLIGEPATLPELDFAALMNPIEGSVIDVPAAERRMPARPQTTLQGIAHPQPTRAQSLATQSLQYDLFGLYVAEPTHAVPHGVSTLVPAPLRPQAEESLETLAEMAGATARATPSVPRGDGRLRVVLERYREALLRESLNQESNERETVVRSIENYSRANSIRELPNSGRAAVFFDRLTSAVEGALFTWTQSTDSFETPNEKTAPSITVDRVAQEIRVTRGAGAVAWTGTASAKPNLAPASEALSETLEQIVEALHALAPPGKAANHAPSSLAAATLTDTIHPGVSHLKAADRTVRWLEDDDLAEGIQRVLKRQARRKGIELA